LSNLLRVVVISLVFAVPLPGSAAAVGIADGMLLAANDDARTETNASPVIGSRQAAGLVQRRYSDSKILSVNLIESKGPPVYRVKILLPGGVVRYVYVDGRSGEVFE
jgi:uncharacterized membrane protein YkoI